MIAALLVLSSLAIPASAQPAFQVRDLGTAPPFSTFGPYTGGGIQAGGVGFLLMDDGIHGIELWRSDGSDAGTFLLSDICPGTCSSFMGRPAVFGDDLYFLAGTNGLWTENGLWKTDGTAAGTVQVLPFRARDLIALPDRLLIDAFPAQGGVEMLWVSDGTAAGTAAVVPVTDASFLGRAGDFVFLTTYDPEHGEELWRTDGTAAGTVLVEDIAPGPGSGVFAFAHSLVVDGRLFFQAQPLPGAPAELWVSDGTAAGTYSINALVPGSSWSDPRGLAARGKDLFFLATAGSATELWKTDGTAAGTVRLSREVFAGWEPGLAVAGGKVYFPATDGVSGYELWQSDGTVAGTAQVADIAPGAASGLTTGQTELFMPFGSRLLFYADDGVNGLEPWVSDGTAAGTSLLADVNPGFHGSVPYGAGVMAGGRWLFNAFTAAAGWATWASDGTAAGTQAVHRFPSQSSSFPMFFDLGGRTLIGADEEPGWNRRLWRTDGTAQGTRQVRRNNPLTWLTGFARLGDRAVAAGLFAVWVTDGTDAGTRRLRKAPANPAEMVAAAGQVFLIDADAGSSSLWRTDGTNAGTRLLPVRRKHIRQLTEISGAVAFVTAGRSALVWVSDGSEAGTHIVSPPFSSVSYWLTRVGPRFFFFATDPYQGALWVSDGTARGTRAVLEMGLDLRLATFNPDVRPIAWRGRLYFVGGDEAHGLELWTSDGTRRGTQRVADILPGPESPAIAELTATSDGIYFVAGDGVHGRELWTSDGTAAGTRMVRDITPGPAPSFAQNLAAAGHALLFAATDGEHGLEPWVSDGTAAGTRMVQDIAPGPEPSSPSGFTVSGPYVYFSANDGRHGFEPWAVPRSAL